ncbi:MAG TPA: DNA polymerase sliding clamp [Halobacteriales archaeon]|uniref:DNA polymerase sliding clamp n=1 Tax=Candidatus Hikarchaeum yamanae TaxID=2675326 RepID=UPI0017A21A2A|nr:DNA polymerase sliding clamp [Halobacteriales archaeon]|tara:strand:+ start:54445 stop:55188 length:744 start_codon:yes stop_codon:yes gene_type:complete
MFSATIEAKILQEAISSAKVLVDECKLRLDSDGFRIRAVDPANVGMVDLELSTSAFVSYESDGVVLGINLSRLSDITNIARSDETIDLEFDEEVQKLTIQAGGLQYTLSLIDPSSIRKEPDLPDLDLPAKVVIEGRNLDQGIKAADMVSDHIALGVDPESQTFYIRAKGDTDNVQLELKQDEVISLQPSLAHSLFSLDYFKDMNKAIPKSTPVTLSMGEEYPIQINFPIADGNGQVTYLLAPRIQSD